MPQEKVRLVGKPSKIDTEGEAWIVHLPRFGEEGTHYHTYGLLTPYFKGLAEGKLLGTYCTNKKCPITHGRSLLWIPPRADCPDCHQPMKWEEAKKTEGTIYSYTHVERGGTGLEIETPYWQIDVKIEGIATIIKSYLLDRKSIKIGDRVKAGFRTGSSATHTSLDLYFELV